MPQFEDKIHVLQRDKTRAQEEVESAKNAFEMKTARIQELRSQIWDLERSLSEASAFISNIDQQTQRIQKLAEQVDEKSRATVERAMAVESRFEQTAKIAQAMKETHLGYQAKMKSIAGASFYWTYATRDFSHVTSSHADRNAALELELRLKEARVKKQEEKIEQLERDSGVWAAKLDATQKLASRLQIEFEQTKVQLESTKQENQVRARARANLTEQRRLDLICIFFLPATSSARCRTCACCRFGDRDYRSSESQTIRADDPP